MAVAAIAISTGKNRAKTGINRVPNPNPEKKVNKEARNAVMQIIYFIQTECYFSLIKFKNICNA